MFVIRILSIINGIALSVLLARWLGAEDYGVYLLTITIANFLALPVLAGLPTLIVREIARARACKDGGAVSGIFRWSICFVFFTSVLIGVVGALLHLFTDLGEGVLPVYYMAFPLVVSLATMHLASAVLQGFEQPVRGNLADGFLRPFSMLMMASCAAVMGSLTPNMAVLFHILASFLSAGWALLAINWVKKLPDFALPNNPVSYRTREWLGGMLPLALITGAALLNNRLDVLMLGYFLDTSAVAQYGIAVQVAGIAVLGPTIANSILQPKITRLHSQEKIVSLRQSITLMARISLTLASIGVLIIFALGDKFILDILGADFSMAIPAMYILVSGRLLNTMAGPVGNSLNMTGYAKKTAWLTAAFAILNGVLNYYTIPVFGINGAAFTTATTLFFLHVAMTFEARRCVNLDTSFLGMHPNK